MHSPRSNIQYMYPPNDEDDDNDDKRGGGSISHVLCLPGTDFSSCAVPKLIRSPVRYLTKRNTDAEVFLT